MKTGILEVLYTEAFSISLFLALVFDTARAPRRSPRRATYHAMMCRLRPRPTPSKPGSSSPFANSLRSKRPSIARPVLGSSATTA